MRQWGALIVFALAAFAVILPAGAQDWPLRPIKVIFPYQPGGGGDIIARLVLDRASRRMGQPFVVESRSGAGGLIGADIAAKAIADGYTLVVSGMGSHVIAPVVLKAPFDPMKDFTHIALFGGPPLVLAVHPGFGAKTLQQYIEVSRATPEGIAYGSPGPGTHGNLIGEMFQKLSGGRLVHVPYKGSSPSAADLVAGHIPSAIMTLGSASAFARSGNLRLLALTATKRVADFPDVPTFAEVGYKDIVAITWFSLSGPAGLQRSVVVRLNAEVRAALADSDIRDRLLADGIEPGNLDSDAFTEFVRAEIDRWSPLAQAVKTTAAK